MTNMRCIEFYKSINGVSPVEEFLETLDDKQARKVLWVLCMVRELDMIPLNYFSKLVNTDDIWEVRVHYGGKIFRLLGFFDDAKLILTHGFQKKTQKTPKKHIERAESRKRDYLSRK